jgi:hypothetical protein
MTQHRSRRFLASLAAIFIVTSPAAAEPSPGSPVGQWSFKSGVMRGSCTLAGHMNVVRAKNGALSCVFTARWLCQQPFRNLTDTEQTCTAKQAGAEISITSRMAKVSRVEPAELFDDLAATYAADHFKVKINAAGDQRRGMFHSYGRAEVIFRRRVERIG